MILTSLIAKILVLADAYLDFFVTVNTSAGNFLGAEWANCPNAQVTIYQGSLTACATTIIAAEQALEVVEINILYRLLPGLLVV